MNVGEPFLLEFGKVFDGAGVVAEEIHSAEGLPFRGTVIEFADYVVDVDIIIEAVGDVDALRVVEGES